MYIYIDMAKDEESVQVKINRCIGTFCVQALESTTSISQYIGKTMFRMNIFHTWLYTYRYGGLVLLEVTSSDERVILCGGFHCIHDVWHDDHRDCSQFTHECNSSVPARRYWQANIQSNGVSEELWTFGRIQIDVGLFMRPTRTVIRSISPTMK